MYNISSALPSPAGNKYTAFYSSGIRTYHSHHSIIDLLNTRTRASNEKIKFDFGLNQDKFTFKQDLNQ